MGEITDRNNQARGFSLLAFIWGFGSILAPMLGGLLSRLAVKHPDSVAQDGVLARYPYFVPCAFSSAISIVGLCAGVALLPETPAFLERRRARRAAAGRGAGQGAEGTGEGGRRRRGGKSYAQVIHFDGGSSSSSSISSSGGRGSGGSSRGVMGAVGDGDVDAAVDVVAVRAAAEESEVGDGVEFVRLCID